VTHGSVVARQVKAPVAFLWSRVYTVVLTAPSGSQ